MPAIISIEDMAVFCKKKGFVFPTSEIYGGIAGFFDYGPLGVEMKNNIKQHWWKTFVQQREDMLGMDGSIIAHPQIWKASGHVDCFADLVLKCEDKEKCGFETRADYFIEDALKMKLTEKLTEKSGDVIIESLDAGQINKIVRNNNLKCPKCKKSFEKVENFNLMFEVNIGPKKDDKSKSYLRPETAQLIFANFRAIQETGRMALPFGIAQMGKAFRNEISPRDFLFRTREFEQMELEFFCHPDHINDCPLIEDFLDYEMQVLTAEAQQKKGSHIAMRVSDILSEKLASSWHCYWIVMMHQWFAKLGVSPERLRIREHMKNELAHYAGACFDLEYQFPFGWKEIHGNADRTQFDLHQHMKVSKKELSIFDEASRGRIIPYVAAEPSQGVDRAFLVFLFEAYHDDKERGNVVLKLHPALAPVKVAVFPLVNKLHEKSREVFSLLRNHCICDFDRSGSIGRRYARADELGIPYTITVDFDSLEKNDCTIRDRDTTKQVRVALKGLVHVLEKLLKNEIPFEKAGVLVKVDKQIKKNGE